MGDRSAGQALGFVSVGEGPPGPELRCCEETETEEVGGRVVLSVLFPEQAKLQRLPRHLTESGQLPPSRPAARAPLPLTATAHQGLSSDTSTSSQQLNDEET